MNDQVLNQSEMDALLSSVSENHDVRNSQSLSDDQKSIVSYDISNQDRIVRGRMPTLDIIHDRFVRLFRVSLSTALRKLTNIGVNSCAPIKFGEFVNSLPLPSCLNIMRIEPLRGSAVMVVESKLLYALVDIFFGGGDTPYTKVEGKDFTPIEVKLARRLVCMALDDLERAWASVFPLKFHYSRTEINPQFVAIVSPSDVVIATSFDVELEKINGSIKLIIPYSALEPIKSKLSVGFQTEQMEVDHIWINRIKDQLLAVHANVKVELGFCFVNVRDLLSVAPGDILILENEKEIPLKIFVEGILKFFGSSGVFKGNKAVKILTVLNDEED